MIDIFSLKNKRTEILKLEGFQETSVDKLLDSIEKSKKMDIAKFLRSIGIPGVGKKTAKILGKYFFAAYFPNVRERIQDRVMHPGAEEQFQQLPDIGPEVAKNVVEFFTQRAEYVSELLSVLDIELPDTSFESKKSS